MLGKRWQQHGMHKNISGRVCKWCVQVDCMDPLVVWMTSLLTKLHLNCLQPGTAASGQPGVMPTLFGFQLGPGETSDLISHSRKTALRYCSRSNLVWVAFGSFCCRLPAEMVMYSVTRLLCTLPAEKGDVFCYWVALRALRFWTMHDPRCLHAGQGYVEALTPEQQHQVSRGLQGMTGQQRRWTTATSALTVFYFAGLLYYYLLNVSCTKHAYAAMLILTGYLGAVPPCAASLAFPSGSYASHHAPAKA